MHEHVLVLISRPQVKQIASLVWRNGKTKLGLLEIQVLIIQDWLGTIHFVQNLEYHEALFTARLRLFIQRSTIPENYTSASSYTWP